MGADTKIEWTKRVIASNGYALVRVGKSHHLSDVRGYAYEHRLVAEQKIGRRLLSGEQVHHIDGDKLNNHPDNLDVKKNVAEHRFEHRTQTSNLRLPGEPNPIIFCACGCGSSLSKFDDLGRPRMFVTGHNPIASPTADAVLLSLKHGPLPRSEIARRCNSTVHKIATALSKLRSKNMVRPVGHGVWSLVGEKQ